MGRNSNKRKNSASNISKPVEQKGYFKSNQHWIIPLIVSALIAVYTLSYQSRKYVEATLHLPKFEVETQDKTDVVYKLVLQVINSGNLPVRLSDAKIFATNNDNKLPVILDEISDCKPENSCNFKDNVIPPNEIGEFKLHVKLNKEWFSQNVSASIKRYGSKNFYFALQAGVILTGGNSEYLRAVSSAEIESNENGSYTRELSFKHCKFIAFNPLKPEIEYNQKTGCSNS